MMRQITAVDEKQDGLKENIYSLGTILDSGCSHDLLKGCKQNDLYDTLDVGYVTFGNGQPTTILGYKHEGKFSIFLSVPEIGADLVLPVKLLSRSGFSITFDKKIVSVKTLKRES